MVYTCINYPILGLVHIFFLQRFSSIFEMTVTECSEETSKLLRMHAPLTL